MTSLFLFFDATRFTTCLRLEVTDENVRVGGCHFTFVIPPAQWGCVSSTALIRPGQRTPEWIIASEWQHFSFSFNRDQSGGGAALIFGLCQGITGIKSD